ncbi:MAG: hypothetical protein EBX67_10105 [Betaproteobacteria bacterium]|nr:hypothetical protein [Betaproteobacteria bacterium]
MQAQLGAIMQARVQLPEAVCVLSGGAARMLSPRLDIAHRLVDNLVLEGLFRIARQMAGALSAKRQSAA